VELRAPSGQTTCVTRNAAGRALEDLRSLGLIDEDEEPRRELLLVQLTARWSTRWFGLRTHPDMRELDAEERLVLGVDDDLRRPGWALLDHVDTPGASGRPRLLVSDRRALVWMRRRWGAADLTQAAVLVAAAPNPVAVSDRRPGPAGLPLAHPLTVELERRTPGIAVDHLEGSHSTPGDVGSVG
jgi:hypothetical protein